MIDFLFALIFIAIDVWLLLYLYNLKRMGCECAMDWRRTFMMVYIAAGVALGVLQMFDLNIQASATLSVMFVLLSLFNIYVVLSYIQHLDEIKCKCSESMERLVLRVIALFNLVVYALITLIILYGIFRIRDHAMNMMKPMNNITKKMFKK